MQPFIKISVKFICLICSAMATLCLSGQHVSYVIRNEIAVDKPVDPLLYGNFIELGFGRCENLWAEMLYNRSFEEDTPYTTSWVKFTKPLKEQEEWWHSGYEQQPWYIHRHKDDTVSGFVKDRGYWPACHSKTTIVINNKSKDKDVCFAQDGIWLRKGMGYRFSGYFSCGDGLGGDRLTDNPVMVTIGLYREKDFSQPVAEKQVSINTIQFSMFETAFPLSDYEGRATFAIKVPSEKRIRVDLVSLMPDDNVKGWRKDVINLIKTSRLPVTAFRFPGGCYASFYNWRDGIGDQNYRPVDLTSFWTSPVVNDFGTIEFVELCREIDAVPQLCVPLMFYPIENTLDWLSFCNDPENELRAKCGHPEPLNVKYWELENEMYRTMDAITYAHKCAEFSKAMKAIDPTIKTIMGDYWRFNPKLREMLEIAGPYIDLINNRGGTLKQQAADIEIIREYNKKHNRSIQLCHTEFRAPLERGPGGADGLNVVRRRDPSESLQNMSTRWAFGMSLIDQYIQFQNFGGDYAFLNFTSLNDTWGENLINTAKEGVFLSAPGRALQFLNRLPVSYPVMITDRNRDPDIVVQAAWSSDRSKFTVLVANFSGSGKRCSFDLAALKTRFMSIQDHYLVFAGGLKDHNTPADTDRIKFVEDKTTIKGSSFRADLMPYSATAWVFDGSISY